MCLNIVLLAIFTDNSDNYVRLLHRSSPGVGVWSSVLYAVLHTGLKYTLVKYPVVGVGVQRQRDIQWQHTVFVFDSKCLDCADGNSSTCQQKVLFIFASPLCREM